MPDNWKAGLVGVGLLGGVLVAGNTTDVFDAGQAPQVVVQEAPSTSTTTVARTEPSAASTAQRAPSNCSEPGQTRPARTGWLRGLRNWTKLE